MSLHWCRLNRIEGDHCVKRYGARAVTGIASSEAEFRTLASKQTVPDDMTIDEAIDKFEYQFDGEPEVWADAERSIFFMHEQYEGNRSEAFIVHREFVSHRMKENSKNG